MARKLIRLGKLLAFFIAIFAVPSCLFAQSGSGVGVAQPPQQQKTQQSIPRIVVNTRAVLVPVTVKDSRGNLVNGLQQDDFRLFQDGVEQHIDTFWDDPFPVSAVVLLDDDLPNRAAKQVQDSLDSIAAGFGPHDEVAIVRFDEYPKLAMNFTASNDTLFARLKLMRTDPNAGLDSRVPGTPSMAMTAPPMINGRTLGGAADIPVIQTSNGVTKRLDDAIHYAGELLRDRGRDRRKIIFLITDGTNARNNQWSMETTIQSLQSSNVSLYAIAVGPDILKFGTGRLTKYAYSTGGDVFFASKADNLERMYSDLANEARNEYTLAYYPSKTPVKGSYHTIEVRVERPGLTVLSRQGYVAAFPR